MVGCGGTKKLELNIQRDKQELAVSVVGFAAKDLIEARWKLRVPSVRNVALTSGEATHRNDAPFLFGILAGDSGEVVGIMTGSPAYYAGIQKDDRIMTVDGKEIAGHPEMLDALAPTYFRAKTSLTVLSGAKTIGVHLTAAGKSEILSDLFQSDRIETLLVPKAN